MRKLVYCETHKIIDFTSEKEAYNEYVKINAKYEVTYYKQYKNGNASKLQYTLDIVYRIPERDL